MVLHCMAFKWRVTQTIGVRYEISDLPFKPYQNQSFEVGRVPSTTSRSAFNYHKNLSQSTPVNFELFKNMLGPFEPAVYSISCSCNGMLYVETLEHHGKEGNFTVLLQYSLKSYTWVVHWNDDGPLSFSYILSIL